MTLCLYYFFFFKQKTAYEMRISDWSSDVCSSDLHGRAGRDASVAHLHRLQGRGRHGEEADRLPRGRSQGGDALRRRGCRCDAQAVAALQGAAARRGWHADLRDGRSPAGAGDRGDGKRGRQGRCRRDRKSGVEGKSVSVRVSLGGRRIIKKQNKQNYK